ncbi:hypothetical protein BBJ28_00005179 [Nothophytophthora sp. Chile5]|nr:hypothetical protein BBJ28_00005179 [Nothophytophthora sp. Chile5]
MAVARINAQLASLDWKQVLETPRGHAVYVCDAFETDWNAFVEREDQKLKSTHMEWIDGKIYIVELPSPEHEHYIGAFHEVILLSNPVVHTYLTFHGQMCVSTRRGYLPDESVGPSGQVLGVTLPHGLHRLRDWHTLKLEVGFSRRWGHSDGQLDWKADVWTRFPGVRYVLCVAVEDELVSASYKLHRVEHEARRLPHQDPVPIVAPQTVVTFDSRLLLGLQAGDALSGGFPDPLAVDLYAVLEMAPWKAGASLTDGGLRSVVSLKRVAISQGLTHWTSALGGTEHATTKLGARFHLRKLFLRQLDFSLDELDFIVTYLTNETTLAEQSWWRAFLETASQMKLHHLGHDEEQVLWLTAMETRRAYILLYGNAQAKPIDSTAAPVLSFAEGSVVGNLGLPSRVLTQEDAFSHSTGVSASTAAVASDLGSGDGVTDTMWRRVKRENALRNAIHLYNKVVVYGPADYLVLTETCLKSSDCLERNNWAKLFGLERFAGYFRQAVFEPGAVIAREGQQLGTLYFIIQGECRASVARDDGASSDTKAESGDASSKKKKPPVTTAESVLRHTHKFRWADDSQLAVASLGPKSATGDISLVLGLPEPTTVQAVTTVRTISLSQEDFVRESGDRRDPAVVACIESTSIVAVAGGQDLHVRLSRGLPLLCL